MLGIFFLSCRVTDQEGGVFRVRGAQPGTIESYGTVEGIKLAYEDLDNATRRDLYQIEKKLYDKKKQAFDELVAQYALQKEAKERGLSPLDLLKHDVEEPASQSANQEAQEFLKRNEAEIFDLAKNEFPEALQVNADKSKESLSRVVLASLKKRALEKAREEYRMRLIGKIDVREYLNPPPVLRQKVDLSGNPRYGAVDAPLQVVEFGSYGDLLTARLERELQKIMKEKPGKIDWIFLHFPRQDAPSAVKGAHAIAACAQQLGKFWELHPILIEHWDSLSERSFAFYFKKAGLLEAQVKICLQQSSVEKQLQHDRSAAKDLAIETPAVFFVNGIEVKGSDGPQELLRVIENEEKADTFLALEKIK